MPWRCSICAVFCANTRQILFNHIGRCHRNDPNFHCLCGIDGCTKTYRNFFSWRRHLHHHHPNTFDVNENDDPVGENIGEINQDVHNNGDDHDSDANEIEKSCALYALKLQEDCRLPKSTVNSVLSNTASILEDTLSQTQEQIKSCLLDGGIDVKEVPGLDILLSRGSPGRNPFQNLETDNQRISYYKEKFGLKEPRRIVLGQKEVQRRRGGRMQGVMINQEAFYVPLLDSLEQLLNDPSLLEEIDRPHTSADGLLRDYCDGETFAHHPLFKAYPTALQIMLFYDDLEACNPLGSRASIHKLGAFYYTLGNIRPVYRSRLKAIQLLYLCKTSIIKQYGIDTVLEPFMEDIGKLEQEQGHQFTVGGEIRIFHGTIAYVSGDNLGSNLMGGFKESASAYRKCRQCMGTEENIKSKFHESDFTLRTRAGYKAQCQQIAAFGEHFSKTYGIKRSSILNQSIFYNVVDGLPPDAMHDILEGALQYEIKEMLKVFIRVEHYLTLEQLNECITTYDFGYYNDKNKPSLISEAKLTSTDNNLKQNASQMWCLALHLPLMIGNYIPEQHENWHLFLKLLEITAICFSPVVSKDQLAYLQVLIKEHHIEFCRVYPECSVIPKMHYMVHMPGVMIRLGPLVRSWCMRYEAKHHYFKKLSTVIGNYTNLPYTLSMRHQQWICYQLQSTGRNESTFLETGIEIGPGKTAHVGDLGHFELLNQEMNWTRETCITKPKWISIHGTIYKVDCILWVKHVEELPCFVALKQIYVPERDVNNAVMIVHPLVTMLFNDHLNAYEVLLPNNSVPQVLRQTELTELKNHLPLHVINPSCTGEQVKGYVNPKYEYPST